MDPWYGILLILIIIAICTWIACKRSRTSGCDRYDSRKFGVDGYDRDGYDRFGYDKDGFDYNGFNADGVNAQGKYDRLHDRGCFRYWDYSPDGFLDPRFNPIGIPTHAQERMRERLGITDPIKMRQYTMSAYQYGKSARQVSKSMAGKLEEIAQRQDDNAVVLLYKNYIYIFSRDNQLRTVYKYQNKR